MKKKRLTQEDLEDAVIKYGVYSFLGLNEKEMKLWTRWSNDQIKKGERK